MIDFIPQAQAQQPIGGNLDPIGEYTIPTTAAAAGENLEDIFSNLLNFFTILAGLMFVIYFIIGALKWITAGDDAQKVEEAKKQMTNAAVGLVIVVAAYGIIAIVGTVLGLEILNPALLIQNLGPNSTP